MTVRVLEGCWPGWQAAKEERRFQWKGERVSLKVTDFLLGEGLGGRGSGKEGGRDAEAKDWRRSQVKD
jgi:hypothetical protein